MNKKRSKSVRLPASDQRRAVAIAAFMRGGGGFHTDKTDGRGGSKNEQAELLEEYEAEFDI